MTADRARQVGGVAPGGTAWDWLSRVANAAAPRGTAASGVRAPAGYADPANAAACLLAGEPESAKRARDFTTFTLCGWSLETLVDDVGIAASELVTNALHHGLRRPTVLEERQGIRLGLLLNGGCVLCAVHDPGAEMPVLREPDFLAETGRGLHVVASISEAWGWASADTAGKVVWTRFSVPDRPPGTAGTPIAGSYVDRG